MREQGDSKSNLLRSIEKVIQGAGRSRLNSEGSQKPRCPCIQRLIFISHISGETDQSVILPWTGQPVSSGVLCPQEGTCIRLLGVDLIAMIPGTNETCTNQLPKSHKYYAEVEKKCLRKKSCKDIDVKRLQIASCKENPGKTEQSNSLQIHYKCVAGRLIKQ